MAEPISLTAIGGTAVMAVAPEKAMSLEEFLSPSEELVAVAEELVAEAAALSLSEQSTPSYKLSASDEAELRRIFTICDTNKSNTIDKRELIKALRRDKSVAKFFHLPEEIHQEDGTRDKMEAFFQGVDTNGDREMSLSELTAFFKKQRSSALVGTVAIRSEAIEDDAKALPAPESAA